MDISSYVLLSQEQALRRRLDVTANNLANMNTVGFKREQPVFREYVEKTDSTVKPAKQTSFVLDYGAVHDVTAGAFQVTGNPLDVMIDGPGYLAVEAPGGGTAYTRAGFVKVLETGELATSGGQRLLGEGGKPITVSPEDAGKLSIGSDGTVSGANGPIGRLTVTVFDEANMDPRGDGMFNGTSGRELTAAETSLKSGGVEGSNVNAITETTDMIEILRAYQTSQHISDSMSDMRKNAIDKLGRVS
ncbi:flagellar hook-basal body complex protein [Sphingomonas sp. JC676]|uniref:flagellar hook-basal body complex protein n=1 Tax=Sphingomonas sp. JC676 TaxID=2768065 RepID=UPI00165822FA|nr:flagellar hook-basal body complex protein [Sphingomonas sp. JC676]MBC9032572.1 flagellar hook-basal body complex protein [Sphingomonas sp. JC676]